MRGLRRLRGDLSERSYRPGVIEFVEETLALLPFLFGTYLVLEAVEARAGGALGSFLERSRAIGPLAGALAGAVPQCGVSVAAASFYAGGLVSLGTLAAVFLSTSDELIPVLLSSRISPRILFKIVALKAAAAVAAGFAIDAFLRFLRHRRRAVSPAELCEHSFCGCRHRHGILVPAAIHTLEVFAFIAIVSGAIEICMHFFGEDLLEKIRFGTPFAGEALAGLAGMVPNCAVSVAFAKLYADGAIGPGALMASSFTGCGLGLLALFRTNRNLKENLAVLGCVYVLGTVLGWLCGFAF